MTSERGPMNDVSGHHEPVPREVLRQVRRIELRTRGAVDSRFSGEYQSVFKGQGLEFVEVREYLPGDDVRTIDWNVSARTGKPHVKRYVEERELTLLLVVDLSASMRFGTVERFKSETVAEVAAVLAMSASRNNDRVGLLAFTDRVELFLPPRKGRRHVLRLIRELLACEPAGRGSAAPEALEYAMRVLRSRSIVFLFSDFRFEGGWEPFERAVRTTARRHDTVAVRLVDHREEVLPDMGLLRVADPETGEVLLLDTAKREVREAYARAAAEERDRGRRLFRRIAVDEIELHTGERYAPALLGFFQRRETRLRR
ncbi:MAG TPA: DUF58 domain-containing protein [Longimicrobiaceae bacterium]|nr:DUF58 domain-containing protein [Longimicrobiaceae bacterium]